MRNGEQLWHDSKAKSLLWDDAAAGSATKENHRSSNIQMQDEYKEFDCHKFAKRIHQESQTNEWCESKQMQNGGNESSLSSALVT